MLNVAGTVCGVAAFLAASAHAGSIQISEIRIDQPGTDNDEYIELTGAPGASLDGLTLIAIGDGAGGSGTIESVVDLTGLVIAPDGFFVIAEETFTLGIADLVLAGNGLNFENSDNVTHALVDGFSGSNGDDLDTNDDGILETEPWLAVVDAIGLVEEPNPPAATEFVYGAALGFEDLGPDGPFVPGHAYRCDPAGVWRIGIFSPDEGVDTPGAVNPECPAVELAVFKSGTAVTIEDATATYTITVVNTGTQPALDVVITDTLPAGFSFASETSPGDVTLDQMGPDVVWSTPMVAGGAEFDIVLTVDVDGGAAGIVVNTVEVTTSSDDVLKDNIDTTTTTVNPEIGAPPAVHINEIRVDQSGADVDEYFELSGPSGTDLTGLTYIVLGDGSSEQGSGVVEVAVTFFLDSISAGSGLYLVAEDSFSLLPQFLVDLLLSGADNGLNFENSDNVTHLLVANFIGGPGDDLDLDDDGVLDVTPWTAVLDGVGIIEEAGEPEFTELEYATGLGFETVGPDGFFSPSHVYRCERLDLWTIGNHDTLDGGDTPAAVNGACAAQISVVKTGPDAAISDTQITYTLEVFNDGEKVASDVTIVDTLPAGLTFAGEGSAPEVSFDGVDGQDVSWSVAALAPGTSVVIELFADIAVEVSGEIENSVVVSTSSPGDNPADNTDSQLTIVTPMVEPPAGLSLNEIRIDQSGGDDDEYVELMGFAGTDLTGLTYVVIGDGAGAAGSGVIEAVVPIPLGTTMGDEFFLITEDTFSLPGIIDLIPEGGLNFENGDNVTHLLVANFFGGVGQDLDTTENGVLDVTPWTHIIDAVGLVEETQPPGDGVEFAYGASLGFEDVGPDGTLTPGHVYRCEPTGAWTIGAFDPDDPEAADTPGDVNEACGKTPPCPQDVDGDGMVGVLDLVGIIVNWGPCVGCVEDIDGDGEVGVLDLVQIITNWGACP